MSTFVVDGRFALHRGTTPLAFRNGNTGYRGALPLFVTPPLQPFVPPTEVPVPAGGGGSPDRPGPSSFTRADRRRIERLKRQRIALRREILEAIEGPIEERLPPSPKTETGLTERQEQAADRRPDLVPARVALAGVQLEIIQLEARLTRRQEMLREEEKRRAAEEQDIRDIVMALMLIGEL